ncbi:MAG: J domain-containing protein [Spirochaetia bacterium]|nr:J domain-containing protein [Spirochaetia bacterium]
MTKEALRVHVAIISLASSGLNSMFKPIPVALWFVVVGACYFWAAHSILEKRRAQTTFRNYYEYRRAKEDYDRAYARGGHSGEGFRSDDHGQRYDKTQRNHGGQREERESQDSYNQQRSHQSGYNSGGQKSGNTQEDKQYTYRAAGTREHAAAVLGVATTATRQEIQKAFYRKLMQFHPDKHMSESPERRTYYEERTKSILKAKECLMKGA